MTLAYLMIILGAGIFVIGHKTEKLWGLLAAITGVLLFAGGIAVGILNV